MLTPAGVFAGVAVLLGLLVLVDRLVFVVDRRRERLGKPPLADVVFGDVDHGSHVHVRICDPPPYDFERDG